MINDDLNQIRGVVKEEVNTALEPVVKKLDTLWEQTVKLTENMTEVQEDLDAQKVTLNQIAVNTENNKDNISKLNKRVGNLEDQAGIVLPLELTIAR
ncbi:MAG: hypothetical protein HYW45_03940 [Candidatus Daviesbacteria bacterium]|nr:MAG: hypothetical protein HYW45_03940 [Candidatus Daviesbacteria bacterium]